jgi:hypothetical protein
MANENPTREIETREKQEVEREQTRPGLVFRPDTWPSSLSPSGSRSTASTAWAASTGSSRFPIRLM